ncbi:MAG TPA: type II toxin-antitoxin system PemK/MazF family toxin [Stellaceae bacterium]|jgi:mRNA interferase MazF|nr:type II toxin-antitoxin system PemK/MazF family toxin [Stellaceae bacterium]
MKCGEVWTASGGRNYASKPRPVIIVQDDRFDATASVTICGFTTDPTEAPLFRLQIEPTEANGLDVPSRLMVDKITTVPRHKLERQIGRLAKTDIIRLDRAIFVFLGLTRFRTRTG